MLKETQISALISEDTKDLLDRFVRATGQKKGHVLEIALRHHLQALQDLPAEAVIPPRLTVSRKSGEALGARLRRAPRPTRALRDLMTGDGD